MNRSVPLLGKTRVAPDSVETSPVVVLSRIFPARPGSFPEAESFVRESLTNVAISNESKARVTEAVLTRCWERRDQKAHRSTWPSVYIPMG